MKSTIQSHIKAFGSNFITILFFLSFLLVVGAALYTYLYAKNFDYIVEAPCDPTTATCFYRDCQNNLDECLPNNLSYYMEYQVRAVDFPQCGDNSCAAACSTGKITCEILSCDEAAGDTCHAPETL